MIEEGLVTLVNGDGAVKAMLPAPVGFLGGLPKGTALPSWTYTWASDDNTPGRGLQMPSGGLTFAQVQIDCYGNTRADVVNLGRKISKALAGFRGALADAEQTVVDSIFDSNQHDPEEDAASRTWRRVLEFQVNYYK